MFEQLRYRARFLRFHLLHQRSRRTIEAWQLRELRRLLKHAAEYVPLYRERFSGLSREVYSLQDFGRFPVTKKAHFLEQPVEYYTDRSAPLRGRWAYTSGTSGTPFTVLKRPQILQPLYTDSLHYRYLFWERPWRLDVSDMKIARIKVRRRARPGRLMISIQELLATPSIALQRIAQFKPDIIESSTSIIHELATLAEKSGIPLRIGYAFAGGEHLSSEARRRISEVLKCAVISRYALEECGVVGMECRMHDGFHTNCESVLVEVVDEHGTPLPEGQDGRVVVTDLFNFSMPFIRYDTGDRGRMSWDRCACGIPAPRVWIEGRYSAFLDFPERRFNQFEFDAVLDSFMNAIARYQVVKTSDTALEVRVVAGSALDTASKARILRDVQELMGARVSVSLALVDALPLSSRGKSPMVADESVRTR